MVVQQLKFTITKEIDMKYTVKSFKKEFGITPVKVVGFLKQVKHERSDNHFGICYNLSELIEGEYENLDYIGYNLVKKLSANWSYHSGDIEYPVPEEGQIVFRFVSKWKGEQLKYRLDLIDYIIGQLKEIK